MELQGAPSLQLPQGVGTLGPGRRGAVWGRPVGIPTVDDQVWGPVDSRAACAGHGDRLPGARAGKESGQEANEGTQPGTRERSQEELEAR